MVDVESEAVSMNGVYFMSKLDSILASIYAAYVPPEEPDFHWVEPAYQTLLHDRFVLDCLIRSASVQVISDLNIDVSLRIEVALKSSKIEVALSCIRPWAMLWRVEETRVGRMIIEESDTSMSQDERDLVLYMKRYGFQLVTREELATPVAVQLFDTPLEETRVYHALFSDCGTTLPFL